MDPCGHLGQDSYRDSYCKQPHADFAIDVAEEKIRPSNGIRNDTHNDQGEENCEYSERKNEAEPTC